MKKTKNEKWVSVKNYEGIYEVSSNGRVRSVPRKVKIPYRESFRNRTIKSKILSPEKIKGGYFRVSLQGKKYLLHRVVYISFKGSIPPLKEINHIDHDKSNNSIFNLEVCSRKENMYKASISGAMRKITKEKEREILNLRGKGISYSKISKIVGCSSATAYYICKRFINEDS